MSDSLDRYHRQILLPGFGEGGQRRLQDATVVLLGCGALGSVAADLLARAGVGHLVIVDRDVVEITNLQRQVLFDEQDVATGMPKAEAAKRHIASVNSQVHVTAIVDDINHTNIARLAEGADLLCDGLDNFETRYLANDLAVDRGLPYAYGAAVSTSGMAFTVTTRGDAATPCLRCLFEEAPAPGTMPTCDTVGVLATAITTIASFQVSEALKILTGNADKLSRRMLHLDVWNNDLYQLEALRNDDCPCCVHRRFDYLTGKAGSSAAVLCGRDAVQLRHRRPGEPVDLAGLAARLDGQGEVRVNEFLLRADIRDGDKPFEITLFSDGRAIIKGTQEPDVARGIYSRYVGT
ncbi:MAG: thiazole biosynthesis adenylyltransferase ThiF [Woeseiaceae bacterium]|nr:ThiF family adenylyltransferase [Gammaproteobacteria bacterium]NNK26197.1 thiazole biosynthesis adenylyltransferase ThiF [Woeseiaceae bacterium]